MGVSLKVQEIRRVLSNANEKAKRDGEALAGKPDLQIWVEAVRELQAPSSPATYLAITGVLLVARSLYSREELDVFDIQAATSSRGYAAASIGSSLSAFAKGQRIDLRAASSQPLNNQPFTFKPRIERQMGAQAKFADAWNHFYGLATCIQDLSSQEAEQVLSLLFHLCQRVDAPTIAVSLLSGGRSTMNSVAETVARFVVQNSDNGKVGQAFIAAVLDLIYGPDEVILGDTQDPSRTEPGDVRVGVTDGVWLYTEAKQKVVVTGDVEGFIQQVHDRGGERVIYFALANASYPENISRAAVRRAADRLGVGVHLVDSPSEALDWLLELAPGPYSLASERLLERMHARMTESRCSRMVLDDLTEIARSFAAVS